MADESDDPDMAMERLEAALERIAQRATQPRPVMANGVQESSPAAAQEVADGLDTLIGRLRAALGTTPGNKPD